MSKVRCRGCNRETNSAASDYWEQKQKGEATASKCYVAWDENGNRVRGCAFNSNKKK